MQQTTRDTTRNTMGNQKTFTDSGTEADVKQSIKPDSHEDVASKGVQQSFTTSSMPNNRQQTPKALLYYPEECHMPSIAECKNWNARLMRHMIGQKMDKN
jgi:hypothetical protein